MKTEHLVSGKKIIGIFLCHYQQILTGIRETTYHESITSVSNKFSIYFNDRTNISALAQSKDGQLRRRCLVEGRWGVRPHNYLAGCFSTIKNCILCKWRMFVSEYEMWRGHGGMSPKCHRVGSQQSTIYLSDTGKQLADHFNELLRQTDKIVLIPKRNGWHYLLINTQTFICNIYV